LGIKFNRSVVMIASLLIATTAHAGPVLLPPLHAPVPDHIPVLSDARVLRLWHHNESSPLLRDPGIELQLALAVTAERADHPTRFDRVHPIVGRLIREPAYFAKLLAAYESHPARFTRYHHALVPLLRGLALGAMTTTPIVPPGGMTGPEMTTPESPTPAVPGPTSAVLMALGMGLVGAGRWIGGIA
jgi:hypothetical protein